MGNRQAFPVVRQMVLDTTDPRRLAEFYRLLFQVRYRAGDELFGSGEPVPRGRDWLVRKSLAGGMALAFQKVGEPPEATWPGGLDTAVPTPADLRVQHERALVLGARPLENRSDDPQEPLRVYADPAGHPFWHLCRLTPRGTGRRRLDRSRSGTGRACDEVRGVDAGLAAGSAVGEMAWGVVQACRCVARQGR
jgi:Glyoxalase-like domain